MRNLFTDESRFISTHADADMHVSINVEVKLPENCVWQVDRFAGGCVMVCWVPGLRPLLTLAG